MLRHFRGAEQTDLDLRIEPSKRKLSCPSALLTPILPPTPVNFQTLYTVKMGDFQSARVRP
jgi:hypothetical protein